MNISTNRGQHDCALTGLGAFLHVRLQKCNGTFHDLGGLQHERQLHFTLAEPLANHLHALEQVLVDDVQRLHAIVSSHV